MSFLLAGMPPRSFVDFTVPQRADGTPLLSAHGESDYSAYVTWLADYLHTASIPLSEDQKNWLESKQPTPEQVIFDCSDSPGYAIWDLDHINTWFESDDTHEKYDAEMRQLWLESNFSEDREEFGFEEVSRETFDRLKREWQEEKATGVTWRHADIPYRPLLNWALRQIPDHKRRREEIDWFFRNYDDNASK